MAICRNKFGNLIYNNNHKLMFKAANLFKRATTIFNNKMGYRFGGLPRAYLRPEQTQNTELISLSMEETQQLLNITAYSQSVEELRKNNLNESLIYLKFSLHESKEKYPYSVNLHNCLMNRISIILKLLNRTKQFENVLEEIYLTTVSAKGPRHLNTVKSLINYMIALSIYNPGKSTLVLDYLREKGQLSDYLAFFQGLDLVRSKKEHEKGLNILNSLPEGSADQKIFKYNNIAFLKHHSLKQIHKDPIEYLAVIKKQSKSILNLYLKALVEAESNLELAANYSQDEIKQTQKFVQDLRLNIDQTRVQLFTDGSANRKILKHTNSHIIAMNIAYLLFETERTKECFYILQLGLQKAISQKQLERVGMALILLGRYYFLQENQRWEETYLDLLEHSKTYPKYIVKQALSTYGGLLIQRGRLYEAENYLNQAISIEFESGLEGLILPSYDFSF